MNTKTTIHKNVMRRAYYSYGLSIFLSTPFLQGVFLGVSFMLLTRWLHVASIVDNLLSVPVGSVPQFIFSAFSGALQHGEVFLVLLVVLSSLVMISFSYRVIHLFTHTQKSLLGT